RQAAIGAARSEGSGGEGPGTEAPKTQSATTASKGGRAITAIGRMRPSPLPAPDAAGRDVPGRRRPGTFEELFAASSVRCCRLAATDEAFGELMDGLRRVAAVASEVSHVRELFVVGPPRDGLGRHVQHPGDIGGPQVLVV